MKKLFSRFNWNGLALIFVLICFVIGLAVAIHTITANNTLGSDFATFWIGARSALLDGKSPYSSEVTRISQLFIYHRLALPQEDQVSFAYPLPAVFILAPVAWMELAWAQAFWMSLNIVVLITSLFFFFPKAPGFIRFPFLLLYPVFFGIILGNFSILLTSFILLFLFWVYQQPKRDTRIQCLCALLLGMIIIKPQFSWGYILLALITGVKYRLRFFLSCLLGFSLLLMAAATIWQPGWILEWINTVRSYSVYTQARPFIFAFYQSLLPPNLAVLFSICSVILCLGFLGWLTVAWWEHKISGPVLPAWIGFLIYLVHPHGLSYEQLTFIIPFFYWVAAKPPSRRLTVLWTIVIVLSWVFFFLTNSGLIPNAVNDYPFIVYIAWLTWFLIRERVFNIHTKISLNPAN